MSKTSMTLDDRQLDAVKQALDGLYAIGDRSSMPGGDDYWRDVISKLNAIKNSRTLDGKPAIPDGYREANEDEHWRQDVVYYDTITGEWRKRSSIGQVFSGLIRYAVPVDVLPTQEDARNFAVVMVRLFCTGKWETRYLLDMYAEEHGPKRHITLHTDRRTIEEYRYARMPYAGELTQIMDSLFGKMTGG